MPLSLLISLNQYIHKIHCEFLSKCMACHFESSITYPDDDVETGLVFNSLWILDMVARGEKEAQVIGGMELEIKPLRPLYR